MFLLHTRCQKASIISRHDVNILMFTLIINDPEFVPKFSRNDFKIVPKLSRNFHEMIQKLSKNCPKIALKLSENCPKTVRKLSENCSIKMRQSYYRNYVLLMSLQ